MVISDETRYLKEKNLDEAASIAQKGYQWARENHTWKNRANQLLQIFEKYN